MPAGRPSKYDPAYCEQVRAAGLRGLSRTEMAAEIGVARETLNNWADAHDEFLAALKEADTRSQAWWECHLRKLASTDANGNATATIFAMKNRFKDDYRDRHSHELTGKDEGPIQHEEISARDILAGRIARIASRTGKTGEDSAPE